MEQEFYVEAFINSQVHTNERHFPILNEPHSKKGQSGTRLIRDFKNRMHSVIQHLSIHCVPGVENKSLLT